MIVVGIKASQWVSNLLSKRVMDRKIQSLFQIHDYHMVGVNIYSVGLTAQLSGSGTQLLLGNIIINVINLEV